MSAATEAQVNRQARMSAYRLWLQGRISTWDLFHIYRAAS